jgi:Mg-chelatase subunit ChlI
MLPFAALVGQEDARLALMLAAVDPGIGGVLLSGVKGTGKSTIVRSFAEALPDALKVAGCRFGCQPDAGRFICAECRGKLDAGTAVLSKARPRMVNVPLGVTEDMLLGAVDVEKLLSDGREEFQPGLLAKANGQILYIDEVNLLPDSITDDILDAAAMGFNTVEREGVSVTHPARFTLVGTMNPEEGQLRPQILDRFALSVMITTLGDPDQRAEIVRRCLAYERKPDEFVKSFWEATLDCRRRISAARDRLPGIGLPLWAIDAVSSAMSRLGVDGLRPDLVTIRTAIANAALRGGSEVEIGDLQASAPLAVCHRTRSGGFDQPPDRKAVLEALSEAAGRVRQAFPGRGNFDPEKLS